jgi:restriction system protein
VESDDEAEFDVEDVARSQISDFISRRFAGHEMARLVEAVLRADGYVTERADPGADGGVDILAGRGELGFGSPRLCVQVKSQQSPVDVTIFRGLQGSMQTFSADQGLLVCWGGFKRSVLAEARASFFKVRLWDAGDLVDALLRNYSRLPKDVQAELPLKQVWALVMEE